MIQQTKEYVQISDIEDLFVTKDGRVSQLIDGKLVKRNPHLGGGYWKLGVKRKGKFQLYQMHRLLAYAFIPNPGNKPQINHIDGNKSNNDLNNLEWCTQLENTRHAVKMGNFPSFIGSKNNNARLNEEIVKRIKATYDEGIKTTREVAKQFKTSQATVSRINTGYSWSHATGVKK